MYEMMWADGNKNKIMNQLVPSITKSSIRMIKISVAAHCFNDERFRIFVFFIYFLLLSAELLDWEWSEE